LPEWSGLPKRFMISFCMKANKVPMEINNLKILFVIPGKKIDSPQSMTFVKRLARSLDALGAHVDIMISVKSSNPLDFIEQGVELRKIVRLNRPDLVVAQYGTFTGLLVALFAPSPKIITYHGSDLNPTPSENRLYVLLKHLASHTASFLSDGIICVSRELAGRLVCRKPIEIIPTSTDTDLFSPTDMNECRKMIGWDLHVPTALFLVGNNPGKKRLDLALEVEKHLLRKSSEVVMKVIRDEIPLSQVPAYLNAADCLVYLSDFEGSPNLIRDACACNTPIVTVPVGDVIEVLAEVTPSRVVRRDAYEIAEAVRELTLLQTRSNGRVKALCYSNEIIAKKTLNYYNKIISVYKAETT